MNRGEVMVVEIMKEELLGKIVETRDGQKWFVVKLNDKYMAFNQNGYFCLDESQPEEHRISKIFAVKNNDLMNLNDILELLWKE